MKHLFSIITTLAISMACAVPYQGENAPAEYSVPDSLLVDVVFRAQEGVSTRITGVTDGQERSIGRWAVFAFDPSGHFRWGSSDSGSPLSLKLAAGIVYTCYAMVNYPITGVGAFNPSSVRTPDDLAGKAAYLGDNAESALLMYGLANVTPIQGVPLNVTIGVRRLVSRIDLRGLEVDFSAKPALAGKTFTLRGVYVTNAYRTTLYSADYTYPELSETRSAWYNTGGWHRGESAESGMDSLLGDTGIGRVVSAGNPYSVNHSFYAFPNPTAADADIRTMGAWTRRCTRLVIEASIDSDVVYYAITVPSMVRNRIYAASNVVIHGRGSNDPEIIDIDPDIIEVNLEPVISDSWDGAGSILLD
ncbi:MAG: hypothetical protein IJU21_06630 [Bacteroidales bacterium]|nr:hypothetical protein [Bacteroidales bacterium]